MESVNASAEALKRQIEATEAELAMLKDQLAEVEARAVQQKINGLSIGKETLHPVTQKWPLLPEEYKRYGRQMIVPSIGIKGILSLFCSLKKKFDVGY
jgi:adenylyltransferase/sulfurtransferase